MHSSIAQAVSYKYLLHVGPIADCADKIPAALALTQHYILLQRNLLYTAITRGKRLVVVVGSKKALAIAVKNDKTQKRYTWLRNRLSAAGPY